tara:strand:+ start:34079 stop:35929 length:1851 start_codon:yes stop_codon:yes gene_type:complete
MCGIVGIFNFDNEKINSNELKNFNNSLIHRGPDAQGNYINEAQNIGLGHNRLNILDLNERANQPMKFKDRFVINYNGEIFNYKELRQELEKKGYKFKTTSDTEVALISFVEWGEDCQKKFNGMWALTIWDEKTKCLFISRDRFGEKPFYYLKKNNKFYFASELKAFMFLKKENIPDFNYNNLAYSASTSIHKDSAYTDETFLKNVKELKPGHQIIVNFTGQIRLKKWWSTINNLQNVSIKYEDQINEYKDLFLDSCKIRLASDVKIGTSYSGGIDSSCVLSIINDKLAKDNQNKLSNVFTLNYLNDFDDDIFGNDLEYSKSLNYNQINRNVINLDLEKIDPEDIIKIIYYQEEISGTDGVGPWLIYKKMRENNIKVSIDGHGSDEALGGYPKYLIYALQDVKNDFDLIRYLELYYIKLSLNQSLNFKNLKKILFGNKLNIKNSYFNIEKKPPSKYPKDEITKLNNLNFNLYNDFNYTIVPYNLKKYDKYSMAQSVECRNPFLDWRLVSYTFSLPAKSKMGKGFTKRILRDSMKNFVSPKIINRKKKRGFNPTSKHSMLKMRNFINDTVNSQTFRENSIWNSKKIKLDFEKDLFTYHDIFKILQVHYITQTFNEKKN